MSEFESLLTNASKSRKWKRKAGASLQEIERLVAGCKYNLPAEYLAFLQYSNGGIGNLPTHPHQCMFFAAQDLLKINEKNPKNLGLFVFATNGAGSHLAFESREENCKIVNIEYPYQQSTELSYVAPDFMSFIKLIGTC